MNLLPRRDYFHVPSLLFRRVPEVAVIINKKEGSNKLMTATVLHSLVIEGMLHWLRNVQNCVSQVHTRPISSELVLNAPT